MQNFRLIVHVEGKKIVGTVTLIQPSPSCFSTTPPPPPPPSPHHHYHHHTITTTTTIILESQKPRPMLRSPAFDAREKKGAETSNEKRPPSGLVSLTQLCRMNQLLLHIQNIILKKEKKYRVTYQMQIGARKNYNTIFPKVSIMATHIKATTSKELQLIMTSSPRVNGSISSEPRPLLPVSAPNSYSSSSAPVVGRPD